MRLLVLVLAIVLLPLRGWLGDAMMLAPVQQVAAGHAMHAMAEAHDAHDVQHAAHAGMDHATTHDAPDDGHAAHTTCDSCQFCHSVAVTAWPDVPMPTAAPARAPVAEPMRFASAEAVRGFKPPIS